MANNALIQQLETLRDGYMRQQKSAAALQATLKGILNAHTRAHRVLADYQEQNGSADIADAQAVLMDIPLKDAVIDPLTPQLRREQKVLVSVISALKDAISALQSEPTDVVRLDKAISTLKTAPQDEITALLPELQEELDLGQKALSHEFGQKLRDALAQHGIELGGRAPKFAIGRFELEANFARRAVTVRYGRDAVIPRVPVTVDAAIKAYQNAARLVTQRNQDGAAWIAQFHEAYHIARRKRGQESARVGIVDCYVEMVLLRQGRGFTSEPSKRTFNDYIRAQFIHDFYEFTNRQRLPHAGLYVRAHTATKSQADNATRSMWIVEGDTPYDGRYIGDVELVQE